MSKLLELIKAKSHLDIKEQLVKYLIELSKHHSIRNTLLSKKLVTKLYKPLIDSTTNAEEKPLLTHFINLLITMCSITNTKYYIPGETKAIE